MNHVTKLIALWAISASSLAFAGGALPSPISATLPEQITQQITLLDQEAQQMMMVSNQLKNLASLPSFNWQSAMPLLNQLVSLTGNAKGLSYQSANTVAAIQSQYGDPTKRLSNYPSSMQTWTSNTDNQIAAALQQYNLSAGNFQTQQQALNSIQLASQSSVGQQQTLQAANQIAGIMVNQMMSLQADMNAANQVIMNDIAARAHSQTDVLNSTPPMLAPTLTHGFN